MRRLRRGARRVARHGRDSVLRQPDGLLVVGPAMRQLGMSASIAHQSDHARAIATARQAVHGAGRQQSAGTRPQTACARVVRAPGLWDNASGQVRLHKCKTLHVPGTSSQCGTSHPANDAQIPELTDSASEPQIRAGMTIALSTWQLLQSRCSEQGGRACRCRSHGRAGLRTFPSMCERR